MVAKSDSSQQRGKEQFEEGSAFVSSITKGWQGIADQIEDYSKKCFERNQALVGKLIGVKRIDEAIQLQSEFAKSAYEAFIDHAANIGVIYSGVAKDAFKTSKITSVGKQSIPALQSKAPSVGVSQN